MNTSHHPRRRRRRRALRAVLVDLRGQRARAGDRHALRPDHRRRKTEPGIYFKVPTDDRRQRADHRRPAAALRHRQHDACRFRAASSTRSTRSSPTASPIRGCSASARWAISRSPKTVSPPASTRRCARSMACASSTRRSRKSAPQMMREARDLIRPDMAELGIEIVDVRILRTDLDAAGFGADLRPHEGRASCRSGAAPRPRPGSRRRRSRPSPTVRPSRSSPRRGAIPKSSAARATPTRSRHLRRRPIRRIRSSSSSTARCSPIGPRSARPARPWCCRRTREFFRYFGGEPPGSTSATPATGNPADTDRPAPIGRRRDACRRARLETLAEPTLATRRLTTDGCQ